MRALLFLLLASPVIGQTVELSTVRVYSYSSNTVISGYGSGWLIADDKVVTAYHAVRNSKRLQIRFEDGQRSNGIVLASSVSHDLALVWIKKHPTITRIKTGMFPKRFSPISLYGYGSDFEFKETHGIVGQTLSHGGGDYDTGEIDTKFDPNGHWQEIKQANCRFGDSGGPVCYKGKVVAVVLAKSSGYTIVCPVGHVLSLFQEYL